jgi:peptide deformylase
LKYNVLIYGDPRLRTKAVPVNAITKDIKRFAEDLLETMYASNGIGLAATQVGQPWRICVIDIPASIRNEKNTTDIQSIEFPLIMINPVITEKSGTEVLSEGCLSFPGLALQIKRASSVVVNYQTLSNKSLSIRASGLLARAIQHEIDHLDGILFIDRVSFFKRAKITGKLKRIKLLNSA